MPPFSVGVAQVEERLRTLRRRLNLLALQDGVYLSSSVLLLAASLVVVLAIRGQATLFAVAMWSAAAASVAAITAATLRVRNRWLSIEQVVHFADQRAALEDRLPTLLLDQTRSSQLKDVLLAQTLAAAPRWDVDTLAPRRIPRSLLFAAASLVALIVTAYFVRPAATPMTTAAMQPPAVPPLAQPEADPNAASNHERGSGSLGDLPGSDGQSQGGTSGQPAPGARQGQSGVDKMRGGNSDRQHGGVGTGPRATDTAPSSAEHGGDPSEKDQAAMPAQLQDAIRGAFGAQSLDHRKKDTGSQPHPSDAAPNRQAESRVTRSADANRDRQTAPRPNALPQGNERNGQTQPGTGGRAAGAGQQDDPAGTQLFAEQQPQGTGTGKPSQNMALKLSTFSSAVQQPADIQPQREPAASIPSGAGVGRAGAPLTDQQVPDAPVQKADVAPEHEALIRRIFTRDE